MIIKRTPIKPLMQQVTELKQFAPPGAILLFRLGDYYEIFGEDALVSAPILGAVLTRWAGHSMCGVPYWSLNSALAKFVRCGKTVCLCDYAKHTGPGIAATTREITRVITPGTAREEGI